MAVLDFLMASIVIDDIPCREYAVEVPEAANSKVIDLVKARLSKLRPRSVKQNRDKLEKYVEAVGGAYFEVRTGVSPAFDFGAGNAVVADIYLNGKYAEGTLEQEEDFGCGEGFGYTTCRGATIDNLKVIQRFKFANIATREDLPEDDIEDLKSQHKDLGTIEVRFSRVQTSSASRGGADVLATAPCLDDIPEKVVKGEAISMAASFGDIEMGGDLQRLHVIHRSPSPVPLQRRPVEDLSLEEARELIKRQQEAAEATRVRIKHEATEANLNDLRSLKHYRSDDVGINSNEVEVVASRSKRRRLLPTAEDEVIDLLD